MMGALKRSAPIFYALLNCKNMLKIIYNAFCKPIINILANIQ